MGRMVSRTDNANLTTLFFHEGMTQQITVETDGTGGANSKVRYLLDSSANPLGKEDLNNLTGRSYYVTDPRGNLTQLIDQSENVRAVFAYDPYGKEKTALTNKTGAWDSRLKFQMAPQDQKTGNYSLGARLLDPNINRFVGADNYVGAVANLGLQIDPLTGNRYLYAGSNPAGLIDDGHRYCNFGWLKASCPLSGPPGSMGRAPAPPRPVISDDLKVRVGTAAAVAAMSQIMRKSPKNAVLFDTSALIAFKQGKSKVKPGETLLLTTNTAEREFHEVAVKEGWKATLPPGVTVIPDTNNESEYYRVLGALHRFKAKARGIKGDARIGATALDYDLPLITGDRAQATAVYTLGGDVRYIYPY